MPSPLTKLIRKLGQNPTARPEQHNPDIANPELDRGSTNPAARPSDGYPIVYYPIDHPLPAGEPIRADEYLWVDSEIARQANAGTLDEANLHILDSQLDARLDEQLAAIRAAAAARARMADILISATTVYVVTANENLAHARSAYANAQREHRHWTRLLVGDHVDLNDPVTPVGPFSDGIVHAPTVTDPTPMTTTTPPDAPHDRWGDDLAGVGSERRQSASGAPAE